jgi:hypothetical protein
MTPFELYKPLRNRLRSHNLWSGLGTAWRYFQFLHFDQELPEALMNPALRLGRAPLHAGLHGHLLELLTRELLLHADAHGGKPFDTAALAFGAMRELHRIDDAHWGSYEGRPDNILLQLSRIAHQQFPWQIQPSDADVAHHHALYSHPMVEPLLVEKHGLTGTEVAQLVLLFSEQLLSTPFLTLGFLRKSDPEIGRAVLSLAESLSRTAAEQRAELQRLQRHDVNWGFTFNALRATPLLRVPGAGRLMSPAPTLLIRRLTDGIYYDLVDRAGFGEAIGTAFEHHVGWIARRLGGKSMRLLPEERWGRPEQRSVDWIVEDQSATLFVECKLARMDFASQTELADEPPIAKGLARMAENVAQLYASLSKGLGGQYPHWKRRGLPVHPVLVTFYEWFFFGPYMHRELERLLETELERRRVPAALVREHPFTICSASDFAGIMAAAAGEGVNAVLSELHSEKHRQSLVRGVLAECYPGSITLARGTLDGKMDREAVRWTRIRGAKSATMP